MTLSLDKELDKYFSFYIRKRFANQYGMVRCPSCGVLIKWQQSVCAHYIRRGPMATRWHEHNALAACPICNDSVNENSLKLAIGETLDKHFGPGTAQSMDELSRTTVKMFPHEKQDLLNDLKEKLKAL